MADRRNVHRKKPDAPVVTVTEKPSAVTTATMPAVYTFAPPEPSKPPCAHRWATEVQPAAVKHLEHYYQLTHSQWAWDRERERTFVAPEHVFCLECRVKRSEVGGA